MKKEAPRRISLLFIVFSFRWLFAERAVERMPRPR